MSEICYKCLKEIKGAGFEGLHEDCFLSWFHCDLPTKFAYVAKDLKTFPEEIAVFKTISCFHGKFPKYAARLGRRKYILKFGTEETPDLSKVEYISNQIGSLIGLKIPDYYLIKYEGGLDAFVSYNFMQDCIGSDLVHIYRFLEKPQDFHCQGLVEVFKRNLSPELQEDAIEQFVSLTLFDSLIGNDDRHGRNLAFICTTKGYLLAPFYDNPSYIGIESPQFLGFELNPAGAIPTQLTSEPTMKDYVLEWNRM